jgi:prolipoprotein diacylglyceryltransferase
MDGPAKSPRYTRYVLHLTPHPELHPLFEVLGYGLGFALYQRMRRSAGDVLDEQQRWSVVAAAAVGAMLGSRLLGLLEQLPRMHIPWSQALLPGGGKTIVGGLLGGWLGVEIAKKLQGIQTRTGDLFAIPLCIGMVVGRIGCLLAGLADDTYGKPTSLPWGVDFGDGTARHPTQAYEIVFLLVLAWLLRRLSAGPHTNGLIFRVMMACYLAWRLLIDFLKPQPVVAGMNAIQWACLFGLLMLAIDTAYTRSRFLRAGARENRLCLEKLNERPIQTNGCFRCGSAAGLWPLRHRRSFCRQRRSSIWRNPFGPRSFYLPDIVCGVRCLLHHRVREDTDWKRKTPMTAPTRPYLFYDTAVSLCGTCFRRVDAKVVFENDSVFMLKRCPQHGFQRVLMADDVDYCRRCREVFLKPPEVPLHWNTPVKYGCPYDCGLCPDHEQHSCLSLLEITDVCNLNCPVCYASSGTHRTCTGHSNRLSACLT